MGNFENLTRIAQAVDTLLSVISPNLNRSSENEDKFSVLLPISDFNILRQSTSKLSPIVDLFEINIEFDMQQGYLVGSSHLDTNERLNFERIEENPEITPPLLDNETEETFQIFKDYLANQDSWTLVDPFIQLIEFFIQEGAEASLNLQVFIDKLEITKSLEISDGLRCLFFISSDKLSQGYLSQNYTKVSTLFSPDNEAAILILLGDASGIAKGPNIVVSGLDGWNLPDTLEFLKGQEREKRVSEALEFRTEECMWDISPTNLTPYHFFIENSNLSHQQTIQALQFLCSQSCITYLGNRTWLEDDRYCCEFQGYRRLKIWLPLFEPGVDVHNLYKLFRWSYENQSSDKLGIVRQIISIQLGGDIEENYHIIINEASNTLEDARNNFQFYLRSSVETYFDKRLKVIEFLQKFSDATGESVSKLTGDLIGDLYKTVGVLLGVVIATLIDPQVTPDVIFWSSLLYLIYIGLILFYKLPSSYFQYASKANDYIFNIDKLSNILSEDEIEQIQGNPHRKALWFYRIYFGFTEFIYMLLGGLAFLTMKSFSIFL